MYFSIELQISGRGIATYKNDKYILLLFRLRKIQTSSLTHIKLTLQRLLLPANIYIFTHKIGVYNKFQ